jgi:hypothetical protein
MKTYECKCGKENEFGVWAMAHWGIRLLHSCECGRENEILRGRVVKWGKIKLDKQEKPATI